MMIFRLQKNEFWIMHMYINKYVLLYSPMDMFGLFRRNPQPKKQKPSPQEENEAPPEIEPQDDGSLNLPTPAHVRSIMDSLRNFNTNISSFFDSQSQLVVPNQDPTDFTLTQNIQRIFGSSEQPSSNPFEFEKLKNILASIVDTENNLMHPKIRQNITKLKQDKKANHNILKEFYPHLVRLIIAVSTHIKNLTAQYTVQAKMLKIPEKNRLHMWDEVLNNLFEIHNIILYENQENNFLDGYPEKWQDVVTSRNIQLQQLTTNIQRYESVLNNLQKEINMKNQEITAIQTKYQPAENEIETTKSLKMSLQQKLSQLQDVDAIAKDNIEILNQVNTTSSHFRYFTNQRFYDS